MKITFALAASFATLAAVSYAAPGRPPITGVSHIAVLSADMAKSDAFYVNDLGGVKRDDPENTAGVRYYFSPIQFVEVLPLPAADAASKNRMDHVAFDTPDADGLRRYLRANGIAVPHRVKRAGDGSKWFDLKDPEDNTIQFVQPPAAPEAVPANPLSKHLIHFGFIVHNRDLEDTFYRKVLGFRPYWYGGMTADKPQWIAQQVPDGTDWLEYMVVSGPETKGIPATMPQATSGVLNHFSLGVVNMEQTVNLLTAGERISDKNDGPKIGRDGKWQFNMYDPDGTRAELMELQPSTKPCCSPFTASSPTE